MGRLIYRMCLIVVLVLAVAGGVYYYTTFYQKEEGPQKGTFVDKPELQNGKQVFAAAENISGKAEKAGREVKEAFVYVGGAIKNASAQAGKTVQEASAQAEEAFRQIGNKIKETE